MLEDKNLVTSYADAFGLNLELREAYAFILKAAAELQGFQCTAGPAGFHKRLLFKDIDTGKVPFAIVVNTNEILFNIRGPGIEQLAASEKMADVMERLAPLETNGELRFSIANLEQAKRAFRVLFT
ncbi:MAG: hypothetical protein ACYC2S_09945 [Spirochaetales bacterium]